MALLLSKSIQPEKHRYELYIGAEWFRPSDGPTEITGACAYMLNQYAKEVGPSLLINCQLFRMLLEVSLGIICISRNETGQIWRGYTFLHDHKIRQFYFTVKSEKQINVLIHTGNTYAGFYTHSTF